MKHMPLKRQQCTGCGGRLHALLEAAYAEQLLPQLAHHLLLLCLF
jgi:hypothetical protein